MGNNKDQSQESGVRSQESEIAQVIEKILAAPGGDEFLALIFANLSPGDRDLLWAYLAQTNTQDLATSQTIELQSAHNHLATIMDKLGIKSRGELLRRLFSALMAKLKKS